MKEDKYLSECSQRFLQQNQDKKIVFTNGCFDLLHRGHVTYLKEARSLGELLFIGLNSDESVRKLKGERRPINSEEDRKFLLENLRWVDCVEIFYEETPLKLIQMIRPNVLVKGGDWPIEKIVGAKEVQDDGGDVMTLSFIDGFSTTKIIEKVQSGI
jgi:rfaE bifunctional protein nucleotidyltransferase chain/domain